MLEVCIIKTAYTCTSWIKQVRQLEQYQMLKTWKFDALNGPEPWMADTIPVKVCDTVAITIKESINDNEI